MGTRRARGTGRQGHPTWDLSDGAPVVLKTLLTAFLESCQASKRTHLAFVLMTQVLDGGILVAS